MKIKLSPKILVHLAEYLTLIGIVIMRFSFSSRKSVKSFSNKTHNTCVVLMNGPSLQQDIQRFEKNNGPLKSDYIAANHFADTDYFLSFKPKIYVFSDPYFFLDDISENFRKKREKTFIRLKKKTAWGLSIFVPSHQDISKFSSYFSSNKNIKVVAFNGSGYPVEPSKVLFRLWKFNYCSPFASNVLIHAVYLSIILGYSKIFLAGANFSFHNFIEVDQQTNTMYRKREHIYGNETIPAYLDHKEQDMAKVSTEFCELCVSFRELSSLNQFAVYNEAKVYNISNYSYLDMFDRL